MTWHLSERQDQHPYIMCSALHAAPQLWGMSLWTALPLGVLLKGLTYLCGIDSTLWKGLGNITFQPSLAPSSSHHLFLQCTRWKPLLEGWMRLGDELSHWFFHPIKKIFEVTAFNKQPIEHMTSKHPWFSLSLSEFIHEGRKDCKKA